MLKDFEERLVNATVLRHFLNLQARGEVEPGTMPTVKSSDIAGHAFARHVRARGSPKNSFKNMCTSPWGQRKRRRVHLEPFVPIRARKGGSTHGYARGGVARTSPTVTRLRSCAKIAIATNKSAFCVSHLSRSTVEERRHHSRASQRRQAQTPVGKLGVVVTNSAVGKRTSSFRLRRVTRAFCTWRRRDEFKDSRVNFSTTFDA